MVRVGLELGASEMQVQHSNHSATLLPPGTRPCYDRNCAVHQRHLKLSHPYHNLTTYALHQRAKKVLSDSLGPEDFAIGLVTFVPSLPDGQVKISNDRRTVCSNLLIKKLLGLVEVMFGLVRASYS